MSGHSWQTLITHCYSGCRKALIFNTISPFVDYYQSNVYYCNLWKLVNYINDKLSRFFIIDQAYPLYEITITVYKEAEIRNQYSQEQFIKYYHGDKQ